jgi:hypothetical protein
MNTQANYESFPVGSKVESFDKDGYYVMPSCGVIVNHLGGGHATIKSFDGFYYSTVSQKKVASVEALK